MIELAAIPRESVDMMWPIVRPGIEKMLAHGIGMHTEQQIYDAAVAGDMLLFVVVQDDSMEPLAVLVCNVDAGEHRIFQVGMAWGENMNEWFDIAYKSLLKVAIELKCTIVAITGRRGWVRYLRSRGFSEKMVTVIKEI